MGAGAVAEGVGDGDHFRPWGIPNPRMCCETQRGKSGLTMCPPLPSSDARAGQLAGCILRKYGSPTTLQHAGKLKVKSQTSFPQFVRQKTASSDSAEKRENCFRSDDFALEGTPKDVKIKPKKTPFPLVEAATSVMYVFSQNNNLHDFPVLDLSKKIPNANFGTPRESTRMFGKRKEWSKRTTSRNTCAVRKHEK